MAHTPSARKRIRQSERNRERNVAVKSRMKTFVKHAMTAIEAKDADKVKNSLPAALAEIDKAASKGIIHSKSAGRKKSTLQRLASEIK